MIQVKGRLVIPVLMTGRKDDRQEERSTPESCDFDEDGPAVLNKTGGVHNRNPNNWPRLV